MPQSRPGAARQPCVAAARCSVLTVRQARSLGPKTERTGTPAERHWQCRGKSRHLQCRVATSDRARQAL